MSNQIAAGNVRIKRAYERAAQDDGMRILIDRLWPRGISKAAAAIDEWIKDLAPSTELREWFGHQPARWPAFRQRYATEVRQHTGALSRLRTRDALNESAQASPICLFADRGASAKADWTSVEPAQR